MGNKSAVSVYREQEGKKGEEPGYDVFYERIISTLKK